MMALPRLPGVGTLWSVKDHVVTIGKGSFYLAAKVGKFLAQISEEHRRRADCAGYSADLRAMPTGTRNSISTNSATNPIIATASLDIALTRPA